MLKSPLRYPGGKSRVANVIFENIPYFDEFREPFAGGASLFIHTKQNQSNKKFWINDLYFYLYNFWLQVQQNGDNLVKEIKKIKFEADDGKALFHYLKTNIDNFDDLKKAAAFFVLNRITFSGTTLSGGYSQKTFDGRFTDSSIERLEKIIPIFQNIEITNLDYEKLVLRDGKNVFLFLDPPYYSATSSALYGNNGNLHRNFDHNRFAEVMKNSPHKWLITYDNSDYVKKLFGFANIVEWDLVYGMRNVSASSNQNAKELFISNFDIAKNRSFLETKKIDQIQMQLFV